LGIDFASSPQEFACQVLLRPWRQIGHFGREQGEVAKIASIVRGIVAEKPSILQLPR
jgi:hypothetical protein